MMRSKTYLTGLLMAACIALSACGGSGSDNDDAPAPTPPPTPAPAPTPDPTPTPEPGPSVGTLDNLPPGVSQRGEASSFAPTPDNLETFTLVPISINLANDTDEQKEVEIPACFVFLSVNPEYQDGLNLRRRLVVLPARTTVTVNLGTYCLQLDRKEPSPGLTYKKDKVTTVQELLRICEVINRKGTLTLEQQYHLQNVIWNVTDRDGLTAEDIAWLESL